VCSFGFLARSYYFSSNVPIIMNEVRKTLYKGLELKSDDEFKEIRDVVSCVCK
jgi:hypothetical protein